MEELRVLVKASRGMDEEQAQRIPKSFFKRRVRRTVPNPIKLQKRVHAVVQTFIDIDKQYEGKSDYEPLITGLVLKVHKNKLDLIERGHCSDPNDRPMYREIPGTGLLVKYMCLRSSSGVEAYHRHVRDFNVAIFMRADFMNELLHEFMVQWNTKCLRKYDGVPNFGTFQHELLEKFHKMITPEIRDKWFDRHPLHVDGVEYSPLLENDKNNKYGMSRLFEKTKATVLAAVASGDVENEGSGDATNHEEDDEQLEELDVYEPEDAEAEEAASHEAEEGKHLEKESPGPMTTPAEYLLFKNLYFAMVFPNGQSQNQKALPADFDLLLTQFNTAVVHKRIEDPSQACELKLKTKALLRSAFDHMSESALARQVVKNHLDKVLELRKMLNDDRGYEFPDVISAGQMGAADEMDETDETDETNETNETHMMGGTDVVDGTGEVGGEGVEGAMAGVVGGAVTAGGGTIEDDMEVEEITAPNIDDWSWQPAVKEKVVKEKVGNIKKRLKILETVAWCVRCGKKSGTRKSKDGQWVVLNGHVAGKKTGRYFPYPSCPDGEIDPKDQKTRSVEIVRQREKLQRIINDRKRKRGGK